MMGVKLGKHRVHARHFSMHGVAHHAVTARHATDHVSAAMQVNYPLGTGTLMQAVDILGHQLLDIPHVFQCRQGTMCAADWCIT